MSTYCLTEAQIFGMTIAMVGVNLFPWLLNVFLARRAKRLEEALRRSKEALLAKARTPLPWDHSVPIILGDRDLAIASVNALPSLLSDMEVLERERNEARAQLVQEKARAEDRSRSSDGLMMAAAERDAIRKRVAELEAAESFRHGLLVDVARVVGALGENLSDIPVLVSRRVAYLDGETTRLREAIASVDGSISHDPVCGAIVVGGAGTCDCCQEDAQRTIDAALASAAQNTSPSMGREASR